MWDSKKFDLISKIISEAFLMGLEVSFLDNFSWQRVLGSRICRFFLSFWSSGVTFFRVHGYSLLNWASRLNQAVKQYKIVYWSAFTRNFQLLESWRGEGLRFLRSKVSTSKTSFCGSDIIYRNHDKQINELFTLTATNPSVRQHQALS